MFISDNETTLDGRFFELFEEEPGFPLPCEEEPGFPFFSVGSFASDFTEVTMEVTDSIGLADSVFESMDVKLGNDAIGCGANEGVSTSTP